MCLSPYLSLAYIRVWWTKYVRPRRVYFYCIVWWVLECFHFFFFSSFFLYSINRTPTISLFVFLLYHYLSIYFQVDFQRHLISLNILILSFLDFINITVYLILIYAKYTDYYNLIIDMNPFIYNLLLQLKQFHWRVLLLVYRVIPRESNQTIT